MITQRGPAIDLLTALARIADAPVIVCLAGNDGATVTWQDTPALGTAFPSGAGVDVHPHASDGATWGDIPATATFVQCDYEWPQQTPLVVPATGVARWDCDGVLTLHGPTAVVQTMAQRLTTPAPALARAQLLQPLTPAWTAADHRAKVERIRAWIAAGDCYQVNLALPFSGRVQAMPHADLATFAALWARSPAPFAGFFRAPGRASVISHSPECFLTARNDRLISVPIKGTRARVAGQEAAVRAELLSASKDAAELAMIVDLVRNDLGRVSTPGSVTVEDRDLVLDLDYVHHRAARVVGRRLAGAKACMQAAFPAGSITGAPKIRAMQILRELEGTPRGPAYGTFGWVAAGSWDFAVAIRTATVQGTEVRLRAGGGIVWDSDGDAEWREVLAKTAGFARALGAV